MGLDPLARGHRDRSFVLLASEIHAMQVWCPSLGHRAVRAMVVRCVGEQLCYHAGLKTRWLSLTYVRESRLTWTSGVVRCVSVQGSALNGIPRPLSSKKKYEKENKDIEWERIFCLILVQ
jgi:hypothetical protein